ncbi:DUF6230 family protein [Nocardioides speluncae]|uniref:DUF6230 family protein n=1 Tax=Nocardioides speluncae TaxID=2670337 RepID=UPI000D6969A4|nr:DUF6230 family protein [Nocardioides speluncae]
MPAATGTRWRRTGVLMALAFATLGSLGWMVKTNVLAAEIVVQSNTAQFATTELYGVDTAFGMSTVSRSTGAGGTDTRQVLRGGFAKGQLDGLCVSQKQQVLGQTFTIRLTAGDGVVGTREIVGENAMFDIVTLRTTSGANGKNGLMLDGRSLLGVASHDATTIKGPDGQFVENPLRAPVGSGYYAIDADVGHLYNARGTIYQGEIGGPFSAPGLKIDVLPGDVGCASQPLPR